MSILPAPGSARAVAKEPSNNENMKKLAVAMLLFVGLPLIGCRSERNSAGPGSTKTESSSPTPAETNTATIQRRLIKEGHVEFHSGDAQTTRRNIVAAAEKYAAYVSSDEEYSSDYRKVNTIVVRVPSEHFNRFFDDATVGIDRFEQKEINLKDVTEEFLDVEARLRTKKELESRFLNLLKQTSTIAEILEIEKQLTTLRSDIESMEGRLKYLENQVMLSTWTLVFYDQDYPSTRFGRQFAGGFRNGWENLIGFLVMCMNVWPFILLAPALVLGLRAYRRKNKRQAGT